jgi:hypothetical protein
MNTLLKTKCYSVAAILIPLSIGLLLYGALNSNRIPAQNENTFLLIAPPILPTLCVLLGIATLLLASHLRKIKGLENLTIATLLLTSAIYPTLYYNAFCASRTLNGDFVITSAACINNAYQIEIEPKTAKEKKTILGKEVTVEYGRTRPASLLGASSVRNLEKSGRFAILEKLQTEGLAANK